MGTFNLVYSVPILIDRLEFFGTIVYIKDTFAAFPKTFVKSLIFWFNIKFHFKWEAKCTSLDPLSILSDGWVYPGG